MYILCNYKIFWNMESKSNLMLKPLTLLEWIHNEI